MQQIERYGVIALLLLLVTVLAVSMWGDDEVGKDQASTPTLASAPAKRRAETPERRAPLRTPAVQRPRRDDSRLTNNLSLSNNQPKATTQRPRNNAPATIRRNQPQANSLQLPKSNVIPVAPARDTAANRDFALADSGKRREVENQRRAPQTVANPASNLVVTRDPVEKPVRTQPKTTPKKTPTADTTGTWTVKSGETLSGIAVKTLGSAKAWPKIAAANPKVDPNRLRVGTKLVIPSGDAPAKPAPGAKTQPSPKTPKKAPKAAGTYTIQPGDILSRVAQRELGSAQLWPQIVALNPGLNPDRLIVGKTIKMPEGKQGTRVTERPRVASAQPTPKRRRVR